MFYMIDFDSEEALYIQLRNQIILGIAKAALREGDSLPSVRDMADNIGINMHTVNKAYLALKADGYVRLDRRRGAVVSIDYDKIRAMDQLRDTMKKALAEAVCKDLSPEEIHRVVASTYEEITGENYAL